MSKGNVTQNLTPAASGAIERFDPRRATEFAQKSTSEETRRAYSRVVREFFAAIGNLDPRLVGPTEVIEWRDKLQRKRQKAATISFKLSVVRAFFGYLKALGLVERNPADAKLVMPPALPEQMAGRALTTDEVNRLLAGPDKRKAEGARDHALILTMLRLSLRVSEVASLRASDIRNPKNRYLFETTRCMPFTTRRVQQIVKQYRDEAGIAQHVHPHLFRHQMITYLTARGLSDSQIQLISGHESKKSLEVYQHLSLKNVEQAYQEAVKTLEV